MDQMWIHSIQILFQIGFLLGVSSIRNRKYLLLDGAIFCLAFIWFGGCTIRMEIGSLVFNSSRTHHSFKLCVVVCSLFFVNIILLLSFIDFRLKNKQIFKLMCLNRKLGVINSQIRGCRSTKRLRNVFAVVGFQLVSGSLFLYWEVTVSNVYSELYDRLCATTLTWPTTILCLQFSYWIQIFSFNFELIAEKIQTTMTYGRRTKANCFRVWTLYELQHELKMVMQLKQAITDCYSIGILFNQLYTFICMIFNCILFNSIEFGHPIKRISWHRYYFVARIIYYSSLSYVPHWLGQIAFSEVKEILNAIRKLLIIDQNTVFNKKVVSNFIFNPVFNDLKFRVCNLFDLTNKQFVSFLSISVAFVIIQLQFIIK